MLTKDDILSIVGSELSQSSMSTIGGGDLEDALATYMGEPDGREIEGRSHVVSTDVADAIEWIMPQIMKSFTQNNEIVVFDPVNDGDERQAELESEYVYEVLMKQNDGFIILHQFVKDALMQRNGVLKVYYAEHTENKVKDWTGISEQQLQQILMAKDVEILEKTEYIDDMATMEKQQTIQAQLSDMQQKAQQAQQQAQQSGQQIPPQAIQQFAAHMASLQKELEKPIILYNVKITVERLKGQIYVDPVPPEEFRRNANHNSINLDDARFTAHVLMKPASDIIEEFGLTKSEVEELPEGSNLYTREYRFTMGTESAFYDVDSNDDSQKEIELAECFMKMDIDQTGISKLVKVTVAGGDTPTDLISVEEIEHMPWVATTAFLMSHKFEGLSIYDRLKQIQEQKTALWRNMLDNMYLQNNQRNVVVEGQVNMDDLLVSRPGGVIRAKRLDAIMPLATPQLGQDAYNMMEYLDRVRAGRTGVDPDGTATPQNIGDRVGSEGVDRLMNAKEELVGLIIRVVAETGIKPLCVKIRDLSVMHVDAVLDFKFRGVWHQINPTQWCDRISTTVRVGTGTGNHGAQVAALGQVLALQEKIAAQPGQALINEKKTFDTIDDFCKFSGLNGATRYFIDPESPEGQAHRKKIDDGQQAQTEEAKAKEQEMMNLQKKLGDAETSKAQTAQLNVQIKGQVDTMKNQLTAQKQGYEAQIGSLEQQLNESKVLLDRIAKGEQVDMQKYQIDSNVALELTKIAMAEDTNDEEEAEFNENRSAVNG